MFTIEWYILEWALALSMICWVIVCYAPDRSVALSYDWLGGWLIWGYVTVVATLGIWGGSGLMPVPTTWERRWGLPLMSLLWMGRLLYRHRCRRWWQTTTGIVIDRMIQSYLILLFFEVMVRQQTATMRWMGVVGLWLIVIGLWRRRGGDRFVNLKR